ncbi:MAG: PdxA family dehydrogenase [Candidatus Muiribacteriaceae bacterium]
MRCITGGDPNGIGLETLFKCFAQHPDKFSDCILVAGADLVKEYSDRVGLSVPLNIISCDDGIKPRPSLLNVLDTGMSVDIEFGKVSPISGKVSFEYVMKAVSLMKEKQVQAVVTLPICKESWYNAGIEFPGHTEVFGHHFGKDFSMIMYSERFSVCLVTIHEPLSGVSSLITRENVERAVKNALSFGRKIYRGNLRVGVCAFNPHGGEGGYMGDEEKEIKAALSTFDAPELEKNIQVPDTAFYKVMQGDFNMMVCMYHDQGLIPFKMIGFDSGVNVTYGIDGVRTSPDHGTAFDIAGKGIADPASLRKALDISSLLIG